MKIAYADPPYPGQAKRHYSNDPSGISPAEVDHAALIAALEREYPDGWALSTSSSSLQVVLALCPPDVRVSPWVKTFAPFKPGVNPAFHWEAVIWKGGRTKRPRTEPTVRDWFAGPAPIRTGTHGAKSEAFAFWLFALLGMQPGDILVDKYPGSRAVSRAWARWQRQLWTA